MKEQEIAVVRDTIDKIAPLLAGKPPEIQGAILADLLATWLAGHWIPGSKSDTQAVRRDVLAMHLEGVAELMALHSKEMGTDGDKRLDS